MSTYDLIGPTCPHCHPEHFPAAYFADEPVSADHYSVRLDRLVSIKVTGLYAVAMNPDTSVRDWATDCIANDDGWIVMLYREGASKLIPCADCGERLACAVYYGPVRIEVQL